MDHWEVLESEVVFANRWLRVRKDRCRLASGLIIDDYYVVERFDFVMVFAVTPDGRVVLVRQYKHGIGEVVCELPAGYIEPGEEPAQAAKRELLEETGFRARRILPVAVLYPSPALLTTRAHIFYCDDLEQVGAQSLDESENIEVEFVDLAELRQAIGRNELIRDCASLAAIMSVLEFMDKREKEESG
ncbi:MAG: NUDIX hydrolase [Chloroflexi bacterium]|nr:NUDIX hydrolase [Chloroflexota bacterium]